MARRACSVDRRRVYGERSSGRNHGVGHTGYVRQRPHRTTSGGTMPTRSARTAWNGGLQDGSGQVELTSSGAGTFDVNFPKRAAEDADGTTSPEELVAAAHSACYAMSLSNLVTEAGGTVQALDVSADVTLGADKEAGGFKADRHRAQGARRDRRPRRRRVQAGRREGQGRLPDQQGARRRRHHARRRARGGSTAGRGGRAAASSTTGQPAGGLSSVQLGQPLAQRRVAHHLGHGRAVRRLGPAGTHRLHMSPGRSGHRASTYAMPRR